MDLRKMRRFAATALIVLLCGLILIDTMMADELPVARTLVETQGEDPPTDEIPDAGELPAAMEEPEDVPQPVEEAPGDAEIAPDTEIPLDPEESAGTENPIDPEEPADTGIIPEAEAPEETPMPPETEATPPPTDAEAPETPDAEGEPDETVVPESAEGEAADEEGEEAPQEPGDVMLADCGTPSATAGGQLTLSIPIRYTRGELIYDTNVDANGRTVPADGGAAFDQALTDELAELNIAIAENQAENFPLDRDSLSESRTVVANGQNRGYAVFEAETVRADAEPGEHPINFEVTWRDNEGESQSKIVSAAIQITPRSVIYEDGGIIVFTFTELRNALQSGLYSTVYLGYCNSDVPEPGETKNGGRISYTDALGISVSKSVTIDGRDPRNGNRVTLIDHSTETQTTAIRTSASGITVILKNTNVEGHNFYGIITNPGYTNVHIKFDNVVYTGRQIAFSVAVGSKVSFNDCTVTITGQEVAEAGGVYFSGTNKITKTNADIYSLFWIKASPYELVVEEGANVTLTTPNYVIYTEYSPNLNVTINGTMNVETNGNAGCMTNTGQYINNLSVGGALNVVHKGTGYSSIRLKNMTVTGALDIDKISSVSERTCIQITESGGIVDFQSSARVSLKNAGNGVMRMSDLVTGTVNIETNALNYWRSQSGGANRYIWNNNNLSEFTVTVSLYATSTTSASSNNLSGGTGVSLQSTTLNASSFNLYNTPRLELGPYDASIDADTVYTSSESVTGTAPGGSTQTVREYRTTDNALLQTVIATGASPYQTGDAWNPISSKDSRVYLLSEKDNLEAHIYQDSRDICLLYFVPPTLDFGQIAVSSEAQLVERQSPDWTIQVLDTRASGKWALSVAADPLTTQDGSSTLPNALVYIDSDGTLHPLSPTASVLVAERAPGAPWMTNLTWPQDKGLHLSIDPYEGVSGEVYTATIVWTLEIT